MKKIILTLIYFLTLTLSSNAKDPLLYSYERFIDKAKDRGSLYYAMAQTPKFPTQGGYGSAKSSQENANKTAIEYCQKDYNATDCVITYIGTKKILDINNFKIKEENQKNMNQIK